MNRLADESSPYLRQHQDNPVDWYPWGPEAFAAARDRDRPILLSVGYSACHWCHVMAHESFEDDGVAALMNELFVNVKVDREERPDVDALYMDAVQALTGRGGWPMTVFLTPDGKPFFGGTYYPKDAFTQLLGAVDDVWRTKRPEVEQNVATIQTSLTKTLAMEPSKDAPHLGHVNGAIQALAKVFDQEWGGFGKAPKFPAPMNLDLFLRVAVNGSSQGAAQIVGISLDAMASGGMYDHLGGGFSRYSVDEKWLVPHFEKMLYDQAQLITLYTRAAQAMRMERFVQVVAETVGFAMRELRLPGGAFASAIDADSATAEGEMREGAFYTWTPAELLDLLGEDLGQQAIDWYGVTEEGHLDGRSVLNRLAHRGELKRTEAIDRARSMMFAARNERPRPGRDDKVVAEWNGLMIAALAVSGAAFGQQAWLDAAEQTAEFMIEAMRTPDGRFFRSWHEQGGARHTALAADLAALMDGFTRLGEATGKSRWIYYASDCADELLDRYWHPSKGGLYVSADDAEQLVVRQKDIVDNATPSANSLAANALRRLAMLTGEMRYSHHADQILALLAPVIPNNAAAFGQALAAIDTAHWGITEIAIVGDRMDLVRLVHQNYLPHAVLAWGEPYDSPLWENRADGFAYVCRNFACEQPVSEVEALAAQLSPKRPAE
ncbi:MAG: thioredoxin domain-containing protein [Ilumatobacteraceae bacterium]